MKEVKSDPEDFQSKSQDIDFHPPCPSEVNNGRPSACGPAWGIDHQECQGQPAPQCNAGIDPEAHSACAEEERREILHPEDCRIKLKTEGDFPSLMENPTSSWEEIIAGISPEPVPDKMGYHSVAVLPPMDDESGSKTLPSTQEHDEDLAKDLPVNGKGSTAQPIKARGCIEDNNGDSLSRAEGVVRQLVYEKELELNEGKRKLEEAREAVNEYDEQIQRIREERDKKAAEVQVLLKRVEGKEKRLEDFKESMSKLGKQ